MNKKVLTTAQVRAMFKNYTMSLAVAGSVLTSASCEKGDGKKDGKSGETPSAEDAKKFVTKDDLTNATKDLAKSSSVTAVSYDDATKTLTVAGKPVKIETGSGLSVADLTKKGYKLDNDKIVETSNDKEQRTIVDILKDLMGGSTGVSLDSTEFKIDAGKLVKKDATADAAIINKTVSELIVDMITDKLKDTVDKNDAKIVVKGTEVGATKKYTHEATFLKPEVTGLGNDDATREVELGKEIVEGAKKVKALDDVVSALSTIVTDASGKKHQIRTITTTLANVGAVLSYFQTLQAQGELKSGYVHKALGIIFRTNKDVATIADDAAFLGGGKAGIARTDFEYLHKGEWISFDLKPADKSQAKDNAANGQFHVADYANIEPIVGGAKFNLSALNVA